MQVQNLKLPLITRNIWTGVVKLSAAGSALSLKLSWFTRETLWPCPYVMKSSPAWHIHQSPHKLIERAQKKLPQVLQSFSRRALLLPICYIWKLLLSKKTEKGEHCLLYGRTSSWGGGGKDFSQYKHNASIWILLQLVQIYMCSKHINTASS